LDAPEWAVRQWPGKALSTTLACASKEEQRRQGAAWLRNRVRSALTQKVRCFVVKIACKHGALLRK